MGVEAGPFNGMRIPIVVIDGCAEVPGRRERSPRGQVNLTRGAVVMKTEDRSQRASVTVLISAVIMVESQDARQMVPMCEVCFSDVYGRRVA